MRSTILVLALVPAIAHADGLTVEADVGVGEQSGTVVPAGGVGIGGSITPHLALTVRAAAVTLAPEHDPSPLGMQLIQNYRRTFVFTGPSLQFWFDDHAWISAGLGLETYLVAGSESHGLGADLRAGYAFGAFDVSLEVMPSRFSSGNDLIPPWTVTAVALLAGYQFR